MQESRTDSNPSRPVPGLLLISSASAEHTSNKVTMLRMKALKVVGCKSRLTVTESLHLDSVPR